MNHDTNAMNEEVRLTAYALGELDEAAAAEVERLLADDATARETVQAIRQTARRLEQELASEPAPGLTEQQRRQVLAGPESAADGVPEPIRRPGLSARPRFWATAGLAAAACLAIAAAVPVLLMPRPAAMDRVARSMEENGVAAGESRAERDDGRGREALQSAVASAPAPPAPGEAASGVTRAPVGGRRSEPTRAGELPAMLDTFEAVSPTIDDAQFRAGGATSGGGMAPASPPATAGLPPAPGGDLAGVPGAGGGFGGGGKSVGATARGGGRAAGADSGRGRRPPGRRRAPGSNFALQPPEVQLHFDGGTLARRSRGESLLEDRRRGGEDFSRESYSHISDNPFVRPQTDYLSTFSIDVDTAGYANVRRYINQGALPPPDAVRIEELLNYFNYDYPAPAGAHPIAVSADVGPAPWAPSHQLVRIGVRAKDVDVDERPATNLVFLIDVSGSMNDPAKLPLLKQSMKLLVDRLTPDDRVALAVYAGAAGLVLDSTYCFQKQLILDAIDRLNAGGSTNGGAGVRLAYQVAREHFIEGGVNRVILATDGDLNVGVSSEGELVRLIEEQRRSGVELTVLGFGTGNYQDSKLEALSNAGNGNFAYIDSLQEARKVLVEELGGTLVTVARDVKIQVDFNKHRVGAYRLIGYENRVLAAQDFNDDTKDAGEIGAGHTVTALYEIMPPDEAEKTLPAVDPSKYDAADAAIDSPELLTVRVRYKPLDKDESTRFDVPVADVVAGDQGLSADFHFASAVAGFGMVLRDSPYKGDASLDMVLELAGTAVDRDATREPRPGTYRADFIELVRRTRELSAATK